MKEIKATYELIPYFDRRKSFYGKAIVRVATDGTKYLQSYGTVVASVKDGKACRHWGGYSATTMRHVNDFFNQEIGEHCGKSDWDKMPVV